MRGGNERLKLKHKAMYNTPTYSIDLESYNFISTGFSKSDHKYFEERI